MKTITVQSVKLSSPFRAGQLPAIDPASPTFELVLGGLKIRGQVNSKTARKLSSWAGGAALQGKLMVEGGSLVLAEAGVQFFEPRPVEVVAGQSDKVGAP